MNPDQSSVSDQCVGSS